ncbi:MAG: Rpn family recombination-promoting nuclease/putative transposase [Prevotellaceae bacterium]|jgi:predicted transposase/invertase (TIGR01784 family)|nr:Rpn family recombination-promoting nuclease/putative transposase [Prevotellaceae bacterium]
MSRYLDPKNDLTFKRVFGEHKHLCMSLLNSLLPLTQPIVSIEYEPNEMVPVKPEYKNSLVDVSCVDAIGRRFIVEMQMLWTDSFMSRMLLNASKALVRQLGKGEEFEELQPVYALSLVNRNFRKDTEEHYHRYLITDVAAVDQQIKGMEFVFVELPKFKAKNITERRLQILWLRYLTEINEATESAPADLVANAEVKEAMECVERFSYTEAELIAYEKFRDAVMTHRSMLRDSEKVGAKKKAFSVTANLLKKGMSVSEIAEVTGLSEAEIWGLKRQSPSEVAQLTGLGEAEVLELIENLNQLPQ